MKLKPYVSFALRAIVTPSEETARGDFQLGDGKQNIIIPDDADQMLAITFVLDPAAEVDKPSGLYIEPATGQAEIHAGHVPAGWTATEFNAWAEGERFGTATPALDADGNAMDLTKVYAIAIHGTGPLVISSSSNSGSDWEGVIAGAITLRDFLATIPNGVAVAADEQIQIVNGDTVANTVTLVVLGKR